MLGPEKVAELRVARAAKSWEGCARVNASSYTVYIQAARHEGCAEDKRVLTYAVMCRLPCPPSGSPLPVIRQVNQVMLVARGNSSFPGIDVFEDGRPAWQLMPALLSAL